MRHRRLCQAVLIGTVLALAACGGNKPPVAAPTPPPPSTPPTAPPSTPPPPRQAEPPPPTMPPVPLPPPDDPMASASPDAINKQSPLKPAFFKYDSAELDGTAQQVLGDDAAILKKYPNWVITVEGHCDERGTPEYNLALGERRAQAARTYLMSLGIGADRLRIVSYGKEFPFDPGHDDGAWSQNRRAHFVVTATNK